MATVISIRRPAWNPAWTLAAASLALMMAFLDALVVTTALPQLPFRCTVACPASNGRSTPTTWPWPARC